MSPSAIFNTSVWTFVFVVIFVQMLRSIQVVPQRRAYIVERFGVYHATLHSGFHILLPFVDRIVARIDLREETIDVPPQDCFTQDEVRVLVDGVLYISVTDPVRAVYGVTNYKFAATQLAQTTTRSVIGQLSLDKTFEERALLSSKVVEVLEQTGREWGIKVHRYEIKNIRPPRTVHEAMERQVTAERERKAVIAKSMGDKEARINRSEGIKNELINVSEGAKQKRINESEGKAKEIVALAEATANSIEKVATAIVTQGGSEALRLQLTEQYLNQLGHLANNQTQVVMPADLNHLDNLLARLGLDKRSAKAAQSNGASGRTLGQSSLSSSDRPNWGG